MMLPDLQNPAIGLQQHNIHQPMNLNPMLGVTTNYRIFFRNYVSWGHDNHLKMGVKSHIGYAKGAKICAKANSNFFPAKQPLRH